MEIKYMVQELKNYNIIVTGGTGESGQIIIQEFINHGASVFTNYRNQSKFEELQTGGNYGSSLVGCKTDLTREADVESFFNDYKQNFNRLDIFLHIMGGFWMGAEIAETSLEKWKYMIDLNLNSTFLCTRQAFKIMKAQCSGKIFTVSAKSAEEFPPRMGAYVVSKSGVLALTHILAQEGKQYNIQANSILPSIIDTETNRNGMPDADFSEWVTPRAIARLLVQLCKPESQAMSHTTIKVYGKL
jgi:NAD(P)-dependent dehydrogenase (short-subunit alcohol dehydrogenase family)